MTFPPGASAIVQALYTAHGELARGTDEQRRALTLMMAQTFAARFGPRWGTKASSSAAPRSKDSIAYDNMDGTFDSWDWQNGTTKAPHVYDGMPPTYPRIGNQFFINVEPLDFLAPAGPVEPPKPPAPPQRDEQTERLIDAVQQAAGQLNVLNTTVARLNLLLEQITRSGVQVHL
jgi:hypothetical protein